LCSAVSFSNTTERMPAMYGGFAAGLVGAIAGSGGAITAMITGAVTNGAVARTAPWQLEIANTARMTEAFRIARHVCNASTRCKCLDFRAA